MFIKCITKPCLHIGHLPLKPNHQTMNTGANEIQFLGGPKKSDVTAVCTHRLIGADGVDLSPKHDCSEDQKEKTLKAEEDEEDDSCWWREVTTL